MVLEYVPYWYVRTTGTMVRTVHVYYVLEYHGSGCDRVMERGDGGGDAVLTGPLACTWLAHEFFVSMWFSAN